MRRNSSYKALLRPTRLLISEKSAKYTIKWPTRLFGRLEFMEAHLSPPKELFDAHQLSRKSLYIICLLYSTREVMLLNIYLYLK